MHMYALELCYLFLKTPQKHKKHQCRTCGKSITTQNPLTKHIEKHPIENGKNGETLADSDITYKNTQHPRPRIQRPDGNKSCNRESHRPNMSQMQISGYEGKMLWKIWKKWPRNNNAHQVHIERKHRIETPQIVSIK